MSLTSAAPEARRAAGDVGPTMGACRGPQSLSRGQGSPGAWVVVVDLVNPLQFGAGEDLGSISPQLDDDLQNCVPKVWRSFAPNAAAMDSDGSAPP